MIQGIERALWKGLRLERSRMFRSMQCYAQLHDPRKVPPGDLDVQKAWLQRGGEEMPQLIGGRP